MKCQLGTTDYEFDIPSSFCGVWDVFYMISTNPNRAQLGRLFAAIIGLTIQGARCPKYSLADADPIQYGGKMQEWLQAKNISPVEVLTVGSKVFSFLSEHLATKEEVEQAGNF
tara:strand:- start:680 stop:1018 length:339 start_codon:yes stop_codon:yes gene_type:complete